MSIMDIFIDSGSFLPVALAFVAHPDKDGGKDIPVEIQFSDYRMVERLKAPLRVRKLVQGTVMRDVNVTRAAVNSSVAESEFNLPGGQQ